MSVRDLPVSLYKEITYAQLRSFSEMARLGNMTSAARSLQLSHPTVWKQIRSLEQRLGHPLLEVRGRHCDLTPAGRTLADMVSALVAEFESLPERFQQKYETVSARLVVAAASRICVEDLPTVISAFRAHRPETDLVIREIFEDERARLLDSGSADLVLGSFHDVPPGREITSEFCFEIEPAVVMPTDHPLARRRKITVEDLAAYPILNRADGYPDEELCAALKKAGAFEHPDRIYDLIYAASIRQSVLAGYGIGIVGKVLPASPVQGLQERSLRHLFRPIPVYAFFVQRLTPNPAVSDFIDLTRSLLSPTKTRTS